MPDGTAALDAGPVGDAVEAAVAVHRDEPGALLEVLHTVQAELGWLPPLTTRLVAERLNLSRAEVHGVVTFYKDFRTAPPAASTVRLCLAEACQARGARELAARVEQRLGVRVGDTAPDGSVEVQQVFCFGNCALGPAIEVDGVLHGRVDEARLVAILAPTPTTEGA
ncbi:NAD(P)H-dependent oxidoreductase subunit E [Nocardioides taihuensis]|uniref:NAD(P)H-dependent oxidoreductase subunit E n=1 Tax=Nocardioides taihuensis TaxID=1835606 RepID=A0ABW0BG96_9ACTN